MAGMTTWIHHGLFISKPCENVFYSQKKPSQKLRAIPMWLLDRCLSGHGPGRFSEDLAQAAGQASSCLLAMFFHSYFSPNCV